MSLRALVRRWLGVDQVASDLKDHGEAHALVMLEMAQQLNTTSKFARDAYEIAAEDAYRLRVYEAGVPLMRKIRQGMDAKTLRLRRRLEVDSTPAEMAVLLDSPDVA